MSERLRIVVSGMVAGEPGQGGAAWAVLQYLLGLRRLGHEVLLVEPVGGEEPFPPPRSLAYLEAVAAELGLEKATLVSPDGMASAPMPPERLCEEIAAADLLLNVSGMLRAPALLEPVPIRAYLDLDPFFNQLWHLQGADIGLAGHTHFVTVAAGIGGAECGVPTLGLEWIETLPPVALEHWPRAEAPAGKAFTSVGHWRSYGPIEHQGCRYGMRAHSLRQLIDLPRRTRAELALALGIHESERDDIEALERNGWKLLDPAAVADTPGRYRDLIRTSAGEIGIAKEGYVLSRSGWFSDRSASYLACGRPVVAQDTGFGRALPTGEGLLAFADTDGAAAALEDVLARPRAHEDAARAIAEELLDSDRVLGRLLEALGASGR
ncbi:MAG TPA: glycosyltransferase [Solirubrobacterales bacterium]|nr:glycosyltransferase [Solirubrobacterales bacterium]